MFSWRKPESELTTVEKLIVSEGGYARLLDAYQRVVASQPGDDPEWTTLSGINPANERREVHGAEFVRAGLHLCRRSGMKLESIRLFSPAYGSNDPEQCLKALADELRTGGDLLQVLSTPMPGEFAALFEAKTA